MGRKNYLLLFMEIIIIVDISFREKFMFHFMCRDKSFFQVFSQSNEGYVYINLKPHKIYSKTNKTFFII